METLGGFPYLPAMVRAEQSSAMRARAANRGFMRWPLRRSINVSLLIAGTASLVSGFLIQATYHMGHGTWAGRPVWGWTYPTWALFHQISSAMLLAFATWHLSLNRKPLFAILKRNHAWRRLGPILFAAFAAAVTTALLAWIAAVASGNFFAERALVEIHDKVVILMSVLLAVHVWQRRFRLLSRSRPMGKGPGPERVFGAPRKAL
jgi:hypothetical protein